MFKIRPVAIMLPDWKVFEKFTKEVFGDTPTDYFSGTYLNKHDPASWLAALGFSKTPLKSMQQLTGGDHVFLSFIAVTDEYTIVNVLQTILLSTDIKVILKHGLNTLTLFLLTANIKSWFDFIIKHSDNHPEIVNPIQDMLESTGFKELFSGYDKIFTDDRYLLKER